MSVIFFSPILHCASYWPKWDLLVATAGGYSGLLEAIRLQNSTPNTDRQGRTLSKLESAPGDSALRPIHGSEKNLNAAGLSQPPTKYRKHKRT